MLQNATLLRKSAPWPPNISDEHVFCTAPATRKASLKILFKCPTPASQRFWKCYKTLTFCSLLPRCTIPCACHAKAHLNIQKCSVPVSFLHVWLGNMLRATMACTFSTSELPKVVREWCVLYIWLGNVLRATTACTFSTSQLPKVLRAPRALYILTCKCASRHNGMQFFISHLASWLRTRRFSEPTFRPSGAQCFATFLPFHASASSFFLLFFLLIFLFPLPLPCSAFHLSILSEVWLLNFLRWCFLTLWFPFWGSKHWLGGVWVEVRRSRWILPCCVSHYPLSQGKIHREPQRKPPIDSQPQIYGHNIVDWCVWGFWCV